MIKESRLIGFAQTLTKQQQAQAAAGARGLSTASPVQASYSSTPYVPTTPTKSVMDNLPVGQFLGNNVPTNTNGAGTAGTFPSGTPNYQTPQGAGVGPNGQTLTSAQSDYLKFGSVSPQNALQGALDEIDRKMRNDVANGLTINPADYEAQKQTVVAQYSEANRQREAENTQNQQNALLGGVAPGTVQTTPKVGANPATTGDFTQNITKGASIGSATQAGSPRLPFGERTSAEGMAANAQALANAANGGITSGTGTTTPGGTTSTGSTTGDATSGTSTTGQDVTTTGTDATGTGAGDQAGMGSGNPNYTSRDTNTMSLGLNAAFSQQYPEYADIFGQRNAASQGMHDALMQGSMQSFIQQMNLLPDANTPIPGFQGGLVEYAQSMSGQLAANRMNAIQTATANMILQQQIAATNRDMTQVAANRAALKTATDYSLQQQDNLNREIGNRTATTNMGVLGTTSTAGLDWAQRSIDRGNTLLNQIAQDGQTVQQGYTIQMTQGYANAMGKAGVDWQKELTTAAKDYSDGYDKLYGTVNQSFTQKQAAIAALVKDFKDKQFSADLTLGSQQFQAFSDLNRDYIQTQQFSFTKTLQEAQKNLLNEQRFQATRNSVINTTMNMIKGNAQMIEALKSAYPIEQVKNSVSIYLDANSSPGEKAAAAQRIVEMGQSIINPQSGRLIANQVGLSQAYQSAADKFRSLVGRVTGGEQLTPEIAQSYADFAETAGHFFEQGKDTMLGGALLNIAQYNQQVRNSAKSRPANSFGGTEINPYDYLIDPSIIQAAFNSTTGSTGGVSYGGTGSPSVPMGGAPVTQSSAAQQGWFSSILGKGGDVLLNSLGMNSGQSGSFPANSFGNSSTSSGYGSMMDF